MSTTTVEAELAAIRRRLEELHDRLVAAERSPDDESVTALQDELREWDTSLERLQAGVAEAAWKAREEAEAAIAAVRGRRIALGQRLTDLSTHITAKEQNQ